MNVKALYRVRELAEMTGLSEDTIYTWTKSGRLPCVRIGRSVLIPLSSFRDAFPEVWEALREHYAMVSGADGD